MNKFDIASLAPNAHIHFIAIGGISMSGLALILLNRGFKISGSDTCSTPITRRLSEMGAEIFLGQSADNIKNPDLVVYSAAIKPDNPEYQQAVKENIPIIDRAALLGAIMKEYDYPVAVAGTHGKTTTTCILSHILLAADTNPTISVGGELDAIGGNIRDGGTKYFVCEACEYHQSFLKFFPYISIILNIEEDHLDYFKDLDHIISTFGKLCDITDDSGAIVAFIDNNNVKKAIAGKNKRIVTCSVSGDADYCAKNIINTQNGCYSFDLYEHGNNLGKITLSVSGIHNVQNAVCAIAAARELSVSFDDIKKGISNYTGVHRRFEFKGEKNGVKVIDDYAHHPTEIQTTLNCAKELSNGKIWCVFQPHTYTRTHRLFSEFISVLSCNINPVIVDIYAAREKDTGLVSSKQLADAIDKAVYIENFEKCVQYLKDNAKSGDIILTVGAGNVNKVGEDFLK